MNPNSSDEVLHVWNSTQAMSVQSPDGSRYPAIQILDYDQIRGAYIDFRNAKANGFPGWPVKATVENCFQPIGKL